MLKRIFGETDEQDPSSSASSSASSSSASSSQKGVADMHGTLRNMLKDLPGAEDVVMGLSRKMSDESAMESTGQADDVPAARSLPACGANMAAGALALLNNESGMSDGGSAGEDGDAVQDGA